jgi:uncharacterized protein YdaU (DUF1376 family)
MGNSTDIWMPLYIGDYLAETQHLTAEESGAYLHLLMHQWRVGALPVNTETRRRIARVEREAWGNTWAILERFFTRTEVGYTQPRLELEKLKSQQNREKFSNRGKLAAERRWAKPVASAEQGTSNAQAILTACSSPSPSPSSSEREQKTPRVKRDVDLRHTEFRKFIGVYWSHKNPALRMPWDATEAKQLNSFLAANPTLGVDAFKELLNRRAKSEVNHAERPRVWISNITNYAGGPLNKFNKPMRGENHGARQRITDRSAEREAANFSQIEAAFRNLNPDHGVNEERGGDLHGNNADAGSGNHATSDTTEASDGI